MRHYSNKVRLAVTVVFIFCLSLQVAEAQKKKSQKKSSPHEFSVYGGFGLSALQYAPEGSDVQNGVGGNLGVGYSFMLSPNIGIHTGVEMAVYRNRCDMGAMTSDQSATGSEGEFLFRSEWAYYQERQQATYLNIPVMLIFRTDNSVAFYGMAGLKLGVPVKGSYEGTGNLRTSGVYSYEQQEYHDMPERGFGAYTGAGGAGKLNLGVNLMPAVELGVKMAFGNKWALHTGVYADFGLTDLRSGDTRQALADYQSATPAQFAYHSITETDRAGKMKTLALGVRIRLSLQ
jgi:hypothetical protein